MPKRVSEMTEHEIFAGLANIDPDIEPKSDPCSRCGHEKVEHDVDFEGCHHGDETKWHKYCECSGFEEFQGRSGLRGADQL